jgi:hypothetical protein
MDIRDEAINLQITIVGSANCVLILTTALNFDSEIIIHNVGGVSRVDSHESERDGNFLDGVADVSTSNCAEDLS